MREIAKADWLARGKELYGPDPHDWKFRCVACGHVQSARLAEKRKPAMASTLSGAFSWIYFSCEGRKTRSVGCDWTLGGLLQLHEVVVVDEEGRKHPAFEFADDPVGDWKPFHVAREGKDVEASRG